MARITVEDCMENVANRFDLVMLAVQRVRELAAGAQPTVAVDRDKLTLIALREIAAGTVTPEALHESLVKRTQRTAAERDEPETDQFQVDFYSGEFGAAGEANGNSAEVFSGEDAAASAAEMDSHLGDEVGDDADMPEPSEEELAELETEVPVDERAA